MKTSIVVTVRFSESDYKKLEVMKGDRTIAQFIRDLLREKYEGVKQEINIFNEFIKKFEALNEKLNNVEMQKLSEDLKDVRKDILQRIFKRLNETDNEILRVRTFLFYYAYCDTPTMSVLKQKFPQLHDLLVQELRTVVHPKTFIEV